MNSQAQFIYAQRIFIYCSSAPRDSKWKLTSYLYIGVWCYMIFRGEIAVYHVAEEYNVKS